MSSETETVNIWKQRLDEMQAKKKVKAPKKKKAPVSPQPSPSPKRVIPAKVLSLTQIVSTPARSENRDTVSESPAPQLESWPTLGENAQDEGTIEVSKVPADRNKPWEKQNLAEMNSGRNKIWQK